MRPLATALFIATVAASTGCSDDHSIIDTEKRELLVDRVDDARESHAEAQEQFQTTFEAFQAVTNFDGGDREELYGKLNSEYDAAEDAARAASKHIVAVKSVGRELFMEWEGEINGCTSDDLRRRSEATLRETRARYDRLVGSMETAESSMEPFLAALKDLMVPLKYDLNAQAASLTKELMREIEQYVGELTAAMQASVAEAEAFISDYRPADA